MDVATGTFRDVVVRTDDLCKAGFDGDCADWTRHGAEEDGSRPYKDGSTGDTA